MTSQDSLTPDQIAFTNAFNNQRSVLAGFAKCWNLKELELVRDGFYLGLARDLFTDSSTSSEYHSYYVPIHEAIVTNDTVAATAGTAAGFATMVNVARACPEWPTLVEKLLEWANRVDCDLPGIWKTLQDGRMEWLQAINGAQSIKELLQEMLRRDKATTSVGDVSDAKMIWMYALSLNIPALKAEREAWASKVQMKDPLRPLVQYKADLWDARLDEWRSLDLGIQAAADRGGSNIEDVWKVGSDSKTKDGSS